MTTMLEHFDVVIIGAGLSGIGGAHYLQKKCPGKSYLILEGRSRIGGTWDLFRYPGIRSDSDMQTMGYLFKPWIGEYAISEGHLIREYVEEAAREEGSFEHIRFNHKVVRASWSSIDKQWTLDIIRSDESGKQEAVRITCNYVFSCAGYYKYDEGYTPDFKGIDRFKGKIVHPNQWPPDLDYAGKNVVVIGSGATAVTLLPNLAKTAAHVTMVQRTPTYMVSFPRIDPITNALRKILPSKVAYFLARWKNILLQRLFYNSARRNPQKTKTKVMGLTQKELGDSYIEHDFNPPYFPWEQRMCLVPDSDFFIAIKEKRASIATDEIETFTEGGIKLKSGVELNAEIIVTATGFNMEFLGGIELVVDDVKMDSSKLVIYKGVMFGNVPNLFSIFGYINASWTLKVDVAFTYICRLLNQMDKTGAKQVTARRSDNDEKTLPFVEGFGSGYLQRSFAKLPRQGAKDPWRMPQNYLRDIRIFKYSKIVDNALEFKR